jgi:hypothetical protein
VSYALSPSRAFKQMLVRQEIAVQEAILDLLDSLAEQAEDAASDLSAGSVRSGVTAHVIRLTGDVEFFGALLEFTNHPSQTIQVLRLVPLPR